MSTRASTPNINSDRWEYIKHLWIEEYRPLWFAPGLLLGVCAGFVMGWLAHSGAAEQISRFFEGALPEIMSIGLTVTLLYYFDQWRQDKREDKRLQEELLWQIHSRSNDVAITALERLRVNSWLHLLNKQDLKGAQWAGAELNELDLSSTRLQGANLSGARMCDANLSGIDMRGANLSGADMTGVNLSGTNMDSANLSGAQLMVANLSKANLALASVTGASMVKADLSGSLILSTDLRNTNMGAVNLSGANMILANLSGATLLYSNLSRANMESANLSGVDMIEANLENADLENAIFDENTVLPDKTKWTPYTDMKRFTDPKHLNFWRSDDPDAPAYRKPEA